MRIQQLSSRPPPSLARSLAEFEIPFTYPLGSQKIFRISHGEDYTLFFNAQGSCSCFIAEKEGRVLGVLGTAIRQIWFPDGATRAVAYLCDLKIAAEAQGGPVLLRLARAAELWLRPQVEAAFGVVMGGTLRLPNSYTGRAGIPKFQEVGQVTIFRITNHRNPTEIPEKEFLATESECLEYFRRLSQGSYGCPSGKSNLRSEIVPTWLLHPNGSACGLLEDTRKAKRLISGDGSELLSAHLSCFAWKSASSAVQLVNVALKQAARLGLPALFVSTAGLEAEKLRAALHNFEVTVAPAVVYGAGLQSGAWHINTSEI